MDDDGDDWMMMLLFPLNFAIGCAVCGGLHTPGRCLSRAQSDGGGGGVDDGGWAFVGRIVNVGGTVGNEVFDDGTYVLA